MMQNRQSHERILKRHDISVPNEIGQKGQVLRIVKGFFLKLDRSLKTCEQSKSSFVSQEVIAHKYSCNSSSVNNCHVLVLHLHFSIIFDHLWYNCILYKHEYDSHDVIGMYSYSVLTYLIILARCIVETWIKAKRFLSYFFR